MPPDVDLWHSADVLQLDGLCLVTHALMSALHRRVLVTQEESALFSLAIGAMAGLLLLLLFARPVYRRFRLPIVFGLHLLITTVRAAVVRTMAPQQAVHWRRPGGGLVPEAGTVHTTLLTQLAVLGAPLRLFEMLGLQMPWQLHAAVALYYLAIQPAAIAPGVRLPCSNAMFFAHHELHDALAALADGLLDALVPLPAAHQDTCSSCPGLITYATLLVFCGVAAPLYCVWRVERAARAKHARRLAAAAAAAAAAAEAPAAAAQQQRAQRLADAIAGLVQQATARLEGAQQQGAAAELPALQLDYSALSSSSSALTRWCVHALVLAAMLLASWLACNAAVLLLLPRVLAPKQLHRWCPNAPWLPFLISLQTYPA